MKKSKYRPGDKVFFLANKYSTDSIVFSVKFMRDEADDIDVLDDDNTVFLYTVHGAEGTFAEYELFRTRKDLAQAVAKGEI